VPQGKIFSHCFGAVRLIGLVLLLVPISSLHAENNERLNDLRAIEPVPYEQNKSLKSRPATPSPRAAPLRPRLYSAPSDPVIISPPPLKNADARSVMVIGDSLADLLSLGLIETFKDAPDIIITRRTRADSGLVRQDFYDWPKAVQDSLQAGEKPALIVFLIGSNDRQPLRDRDMVLEPLSEGWKTLYRQRINAMTTLFAQRGIPLIWVGAPPMRNARLSADINALNTLYRQEAEKSGALYVDLWEAFVDADRLYAQDGPDIRGQIIRLRTSDGVHFTAGGARKAAHFVSLEIQDVLHKKTPPLPVKPALLDPALPSPAAQTSKPTIGPVLLLNDPVLLLNDIERASDGRLLVAPHSMHNSLAAQAFQQGLVPSPKAGRLDDMRWQP
jgi:uncharacterized protein